MKKISACLGAVAAALLLFACAGCSEQTFTEKSYTSDENAVTEIAIDAEDREIEVSASEDGRVHIGWFDSEEEYLDLSVSDGVLTATLCYDKDWTDYIGVKPAAEYRRIEVKVPEGVAVFSASTTNEDITVTALSCTESVSLASNGGCLVFERLDAGASISLTAKNGDITGSVAGSMEDFSLSCTIKKGDCNLPTSWDGGPKSLSVDCNNGDIEVTFVQ